MSIGGPRSPRSSSFGTHQVSEAMERPADGLLAEVPAQLEAAGGRHGLVDQVDLSGDGGTTHLVADGANGPDAAEPVVGERGGERGVVLVEQVAHPRTDTTAPGGSEHPGDLAVGGAVADPDDHIRMWQVAQHVGLTGQAAGVVFDAVVLGPPAIVVGHVAGEVR